MVDQVNLNDDAIHALFADPDGPIADIVERLCLSVENVAKRKLLEPKSGRIYDTRFWRDSQGRLRRGGPRPPHQASAPGEAPASDTGHLLNSIGHSVGIEEGVVVGRVGSHLQEMAWLEMGTRYMEPRPLLRPSLVEGLAEGHR